MDRNYFYSGQDSGHIPLNPQFGGYCERPTNQHNNVFTPRYIYTFHPQIAPMYQNSSNSNYALANSYLGQRHVQDGYGNSYSQVLNSSAIGNANPAKYQLPVPWGQSLRTGNDYDIHRPLSAGRTFMHETRPIFETQPGYVCADAAGVNFGYFSNDGRDISVSKDSRSFRNHVISNQNGYQNQQPVDMNAGAPSYALHPKRMKSLLTHEQSVQPPQGAPDTMTFLSGTPTDENQANSNRLIGIAPVASIPRTNIEQPASVTLVECSTERTLEQPEQQITEIEWKKVLEWGHMTQPTPFTQMTDSQWVEVFKTIGIETSKSGSEIRDDFFSLVVPNLPQLEKGFNKTRLSLEVCDTRACMAIYHSLKNPTISGIRSIIDELIKSQILTTEINSLEDWTKLFVLKVLSTDTKYRPLNADTNEFIRRKEAIVSDLTNRIDLSQYCISNSINTQSS